MKPQNKITLLIALTTLTILTLISIKAGLDFNERYIEPESLKAGMPVKAPNPTILSILAFTAIITIVSYLVIDNFTKIYEETK